MPIGWNRVNTLLLVLVLLVLAGAFARGVLGGPLDPPGPPAWTMKTLEQVEPRIPISQPASVAGFPITISQPGSYYLTGNITGVAGQDGIQISAGDVTLDLNGFSLNGVPSSGNGIYSTGRNTAVRNGSISHWGNAGALVTSPNARFDKVQASNNNNAGFWITSPSTLVEDCVAMNNSGFGILLSGMGGVIRDSYAGGNTTYGIGTNAAMVVEGNDLVSNTQGGIQVGTASTIKDNTISFSSSIGAYAGIYVTGAMDRIEGNTVTGDYPSGTVPFGIEVPGTHNLVVRNGASYNVDNFDIAAGNIAGPEETAAATGPWSNVNY